MTDPLRLGIVGCGRVVERFHLPAIRSSHRWQIGALCDSDPDRRKWAERAAPGAAVFGALTQMLDHDDLDAVLIASPPSLHVELATEAVDRGLHVLIEKPGGRSPADAEQLARIAARSNRVVWVGFNRRFKPTHQSARDFVAASFPVSGAVATYDLAFSVTEWDSITGYLGIPDRGGGAVHDLASHQIDLLSWMFSSPVTAVRCRLWQRPTPDLERIEYDVRLAMGLTIRCTAAHGEGYREALYIEGESESVLSYPTGLLRSRGGNRRALQRWAKVRYWIDRKLIRVRMLADPLQRSFRGQLEAFAVAIRGGRPIVSGRVENTLVMTHRAMQALIDGRDLTDEWQAVALAS